MSISTKETIGLKVRPTPMPKDYRAWLGDLPLKGSWSMIVFGGSFSGKTTWLLDFASMLSYHGPALYCNIEESMDGGTMQMKMRRMNLTSKYPWCKTKLKFLFEKKVPVNQLADYIDEELKKGYKYCVIDSLQSVCKRTSEVEGFVDKYISNYPNTSFIFVLHGTKDEKNYKGSTYLKHMTDVTIEMKKGIADCELKNRYKNNNEYFKRNIFTKELLN